MFTHYLRPIISLLSSIFNYFMPPHPIKEVNKTVYYDFETTGLNVFHDRIIDYCFLNDEDDHCIESLVNPKGKFEFIITKITGIHPQDVEDKLPIKDHLKDIVEFLESPTTEIINTVYLVAHNGAGFDDIILQNTLHKYNVKPDIKMKFIDTLLIAKKLKVNDKYSLKALCECYNIKPGKHRAKSDTVALKELYYILTSILANKLNTEVHTLLNNPQMVHKWLYNYL
jgi:DNA polymerase III alpha subunit (gram-positive type)